MGEGEAPALPAPPGGFCRGWFGIAGADPAVRGRLRAPLQLSVLYRALVQEPSDFTLFHLR